MQEISNLDKDKSDKDKDKEQKEIIDDWICEDEFEERLKSTLIKLKECQNDKKVDTCSKCDLFFGCKTRNQYVDAVYFSMSKGATGGFEF